MPLYNKVLLPGAQQTNKTDSKDAQKPKPTSNASMKLLQDHLAAKRRHLKPQSVSGLKSVPKSSHDNRQTIVTELHKPSEDGWEPEEEYDPRVPNSYEILQAEYLRIEEQRQMALASRKTISASTTKPPMTDLLDVIDRFDNDETETATSSSRRRGTAIAPPPSLASVTSDEPLEGPAKPSCLGLGESSGPTRQQQQTETSSRSGSAGSVGSVAAKIMSKMGYKAGLGLGKDKQGMSSPLEVEKSGVNAGRIVVGYTTHPTSQDEKCDLTPDRIQREAGQQADMDDAKPKTSPKINVADHDGKDGLDPAENFTRVLLLQNMVGPGEVDDDLETETREECKKYGHVVKCLIYEIPHKRVPDDQAVRIFIEFQKVESAIKAANDLNGRYFGGRTVRASFYDVERFHKYDLGR